MASILTAANRQLIETMDADDASRLDLKQPGDSYYKTNRINQAAAAAMAKLNPVVGSVAVPTASATAAVSFSDIAGATATRADATYTVITSIEVTNGDPVSEFAWAASKATTGFTMTLDAAAATGGATVTVNFIVVG